MTRYIQRLAHGFDQETYKIHIRIILLNIPNTSPLFVGSEAGLMGIYFKVKRGSNRTNGKNRYAVYKADGDAANVLIDESFEQLSVFYRNQQNKALFQQK